MCVKQKIVREMCIDVFCFVMHARHTHTAQAERDDVSIGAEKATDRRIHNGATG